MFAICNPAHELLRVAVSGRNLVTHSGETISDASRLSRADLLARYVIPIDDSGGPDYRLFRCTGDHIDLDWPRATRVYDGAPIPAAEIRAKAVADTKAMAAALLTPTDWMVIRQAEGGAAVPAEILAFRAAVRTASNDAEAALAAAGDDAEAILAVIADWPELTTEEASQ